MVFDVSDIAPPPPSAPCAVLSRRVEAGRGANR
jgi:hypothetical protein